MGSFDVESKKPIIASVFQCHAEAPSVEKIETEMGKTRRKQGNYLKP